MKPNETFAVQKTESDWKNELTPAAFCVLREHGTERAGSSPLDKEHRPGVFNCAACGQALFLSDTKFNSGTRWKPRFYWAPERHHEPLDLRAFGRYPVLVR